MSLRSNRGVDPNVLEPKKGEKRKKKKKKRERGKKGKGERKKEGEVFYKNRSFSRLTVTALRAERSEAHVGNDFRKNEGISAPRNLPGATPVP